MSVTSAVSALNSLFNSRCNAFDTFLSLLSTNYLMRIDILPQSPRDYEGSIRVILIAPFMRMTNSSSHPAALNGSTVTGAAASDDEL